MLFRTHLAFSLCLFLALYVFIESPWFFLLGLLCGTFIVDIDSKKSMVGNYFLLRPLQFFLKHRGMVHSLFFGCIVTALLAVFHVGVAVGFLIGFLGHLFLDSFTKQRVKLLWPLFDTRFGLGLFKSGGLVEMIIFVVLFFVAVFLLFYRFVM